jgi:hypothetical protein
MKMWGRKTVCIEPTLAVDKREGIMRSRESFGIGGQPIRRSNIASGLVGVNNLESFICRQGLVALKVSLDGN